MSHAPTEVSTGPGDSKAQHAPPQLPHRGYGGAVALSVLVAGVGQRRIEADVLCGQLLVLLHLMGGGGGGQLLVLLHLTGEGGAASSWHFFTTGGGGLGFRRGGGGGQLGLRGRRGKGKGGRDEGGIGTYAKPKSV